MQNRARVRLFVRRRMQLSDSRVVLGDADLFDAVCESIAERYASAMGPVQDFLEWLIANADAIIALIKKIIELFS